MKKLLLASISSCLFLISCGEKSEVIHEEKLDSKKETEVRNDVMTKELQNASTPEQVLEVLKAGNVKFVKGDLTFTDYPKQIMQTSQGQFPTAVVLSCLDSRVPVEKVFDLGIGDIFVARVAGNIINPDILASMEYGCKVVGSKLIVVLGHTECGAVKAAIDDVKLGNITELLEKIKPSVDSLSKFEGDKTSKNKEYVTKVTDENVLVAIEEIRKNSPILKEMEEKGEIDIVGGLYDVSTGSVTFMK
ncbi:MAG TPA: carbonic anhydrase family protein [Ignavibacteria bacterium]|nr:carbonic anhydrase family protein [Ignavibacteria bacterium]